VSTTPGNGKKPDDVQPVDKDASQAGGAAAADHLAELLFTGEGLSSGSYTPAGYQLRLAGLDETADRVVHAHETHHAALNDSTAWGTALHVYARLPAAFRDTFRKLLDRCRATHESYATFGSVNMLRTLDRGAQDVLAVYPAYAPLYQVVTDLVRPAGGPQRQYALATALARACMQTPVLEVMAEVGLSQFALSSLREMDRPDRRWQWLRKQGPGVFAVAAEAADSAVRAVHGGALADADTWDAHSEILTGQEWDPAWRVWEEAAYSALAATLTARGARCLSFDGHQIATGAVVALARQVAPHVGVAAAGPHAPAPDDRALAASVLAQVRHVFVTPPHRARLTELSPADLPELVELSPRIDGQSALVVDARLPGRLRDGYTWDSADLPQLAQLTASRTPVVAVRLFEDADGDSMIVHCRLPEPGLLGELAARWGGPRPLIACVAASCFIDEAWQQLWRLPLEGIGHFFVLLDVELDRVVKSWVRQGSPISLTRVNVDDASGEHRIAVAITVPPRPAVWVTIGDQMTAGLIGEQLERTPGVRLDLSAAHLEGWHDSLTVILTHLRATESFVDFGGLEGYL
jgi:hypothetical protein